MKMAKIDKDKFVDYIQKDNNVIEEGEISEVNNRQLEKLIVQFCANLTAKAKAKNIDPVIGREKELEELTLVLARRHKSNVMLIGDPGVGKTAIAEGLAKKIEEGAVPEFIKNHTVYALDISAMLAGSKIGRAHV